MYKCGLMVMVVTGLIVCPHHITITLVYTTTTAHHVITHMSTEHLFINIVPDVNQENIYNMLHLDF